MTARRKTVVALAGILSIIAFGSVIADKAPKEWSRTQPYPQHDVYYPGTEALGSDEMRVIACGTGMPTPRL